MPQIKIDIELGKTIKTLRIQNDLSAATLAKEMGKSTGYISNIENAKRKTMELFDLYKMFEILISEENSRNEIITDILKRLSVSLTPKEIKKQEWMYTFDHQYRMHPIGARVIDTLKKSIEETRLSCEDIIDEMNKNKDLDFKGTNEQIEYNKIYIKISNSDKTPDDMFIKFKLPSRFLNDIIEGKVTSINYITLYGIFYTMNKLLGCDEHASHQNSHRTMQDLQIFTLSEQREFLISKNIKNEIFPNDLDTNNLPEGYADYLQYTKYVFSKFTFFRDLDVAYINSKLKVFCENMKQNPSFTIALMGLSLEPVKDLDKESLKQMLGEIQQVITNYSPKVEEDNQSFVMY